MIFYVLDQKDTFIVSSVCVNDIHGLGGRIQICNCYNKWPQIGLFILFKALG